MRSESHFFVPLDFLTHISRTLNEEKVRYIVNVWIYILELNKNKEDLDAKKALVYRLTNGLIVEWSSKEMKIRKLKADKNISQIIYNTQATELINEFMELINIYWVEVKKVLGSIPSKEDLSVVFEKSILGAWLITIAFKAAFSKVPTGSLDSLLSLQKVRNLEYYTLQDIREYVNNK